MWGFAEKIPLLPVLYHRLCYVFMSPMAILIPEVFAACTLEIWTNQYPSKNGCLLFFWIKGTYLVATLTSNKKIRGYFCFFVYINFVNISGLYRRNTKIPRNNERKHLSHEKKPPTFHYTGWLIGILIMVY